jgi:hypothetical protein
MQNYFFYRLHINNYNFTISQIASTCLQAWKIAKLPNHQITNYNIYNYKVNKLHVHIYKFQNNNNN